VRQEQAQNETKSMPPKAQKTTTLSIAYTLAEDAVSCEPVSALNSLANREINREFRKNLPSNPIFASDQHADPMAYSGIPYATEQGISKRVSANCFQRTGNFYRKIAALDGSSLGTKPTLRGSDQ
jgi:hypothetical protein